MLFCRCSSTLEQLNSNQQMECSIPPAGSSIIGLTILNGNHHTGQRCPEAFDVRSSEAQTSVSDSADAPLKSPPKKQILLVSNLVMHYRVSVYNSFHRRFDAMGYNFSVLASALQKENKKPLEFEFRELPFNYSKY